MSNTQTVIHRYGTTWAGAVSEDTPEILNCDQAKEFFITWEEGVVSVSMGMDLRHVFITYHDSHPFDVKYMSLSTAWDAAGEWEVPHSMGRWQHVPL